MKTYDEAVRRALEVHTERAIGRAVLAAAQTGRELPPGEPTHGEEALAKAVVEVTQRDLEAARAEAATLRAAGEELRLAAVAADRSAAAARETRDVALAQLRDSRRDLENAKREAVELRGERDRVVAIHEELVKRVEAERHAVQRDLAKARQATDAANDELNRLRRVGVAPPT